MKRMIGKRVACFLMACVLLLSIAMPVYAEETVKLAYDENALVSEFTPQIVEDAYRYLDEIYLEKYPEFALSTVFGSEVDNTQLQNLADAIAQGCETDREKAYAVYEWINRNIVYDETAYDYPIDVFMTRKGICNGYAMFMRDLLRKMGVKAVASNGWRNNMYLVTMGVQFAKQENGMYERAGHAWCFVYLDGEWELFDPLNQVKGTSDKKFIADHYYISNIERVTPAYRYPELQYVYMDTIYNGEKFIGLQIETGEIAKESTFTWQIVNWHLLFQSRIHQSEFAHEDLYALDGGEMALPMEDGDIYYGGKWFFRQDSLAGSPGALEDYRYEYSYIRENGIISTNQIKELGDRTFFLNGTIATDISPIADLNLTTMNGGVVIPVGYHGKLINSEYEKVFGTDTHQFIWTSSDESVATVDENGIVTVHSEGVFQLELTVKRIYDDASLGGELIGFCTAYQNREPNYSDSVNHVHSYEKLTREAACDIGGVVMYTCADPDCADSYIESESQPIGHSFTSYASDGNATQKQEGTKTSHCDNAGCTATNTTFDEGSKASQKLKETVADRGIYVMDEAELNAYIDTLEASWMAELEAKSNSGIEIPISCMRSMSEKQVGMTIALYDTFIILQPETLTSIMNSCTGDSIVFCVREMGAAELNQAQKDALSDLDAAMLISTEIYSGNVQVHEFEGAIDIQFPFYTEGDNTAYGVYYLAEDGSLTACWNGWEDYDGGKMSFNAEHFSEYVVAKNVPQNLVANAEGGNDLPIPVIVISVVVLVAVIAVVVLIAKKKKEKF